MDVEAVGGEIIDEGEGEVNEARKSSIDEEEPDAGIESPGLQEFQRHREFADATEFHEGTEEAMTPRAARSPAKPGAKEVEDHDLSHCPPRSWCVHCVKGQAKDFRHETVRGDYAESLVARVCMDYCFLTEGVKKTEDSNANVETAKTSLTVLVMTETECKSIWAYAVEVKGGSDPWIVEQIVEDLETIGLTEERLVLKTDQESSITDLQKEIALARKGHGTAIENSRIGDSNSNGRVERAIQDVEGLIRTLRSATEEKIGVRIELSDSIVPWLVRHAGAIITMCRIRSNGRTAYQLMKGRRSNAKLVNFAESVMFKIPKTSQRVGKFEDRWEIGIWVGITMRTGEHLVATSQGVFRVSTIMRRPADQRWSEELVKGMKGTPGEPVPGSSGRRIPAFAIKYKDARPENIAYAPMPAMEEDQDPRRAKIQKEDIETYGPSEKCPGCRAQVAGKYRSKHTDECRSRFEKVLAQDDKGRRRFEAAAARRLNAITKKACELQETIEKQAAAATPDPDPDLSRNIQPSGSASGSGLTVEQRSEELRQLKDSEMRQRLADSKGEKRKASEDPSITDEDATATPATAQTGTKRKAEEQDLDASRADRGSAEAQDTSGTSKGKAKRKAEDANIDESRASDRASDMSSLQRETRMHPGQSHRGIKYNKEDLEWNHVGSGIFARTFLKASKMITTSRGGPPMMDVHRRVIRSLTTGKVLDDCIVDEVKDDVLHRPLKQEDSIRVELTMKGALKLFEVKGPDVVEVFSQPRVTQEAEIQKGVKLRPGWSLDLTLDDPLTGQAWDLGKHEVRKRIRSLVKETKPFMVIGSLPCAEFYSIQSMLGHSQDRAKMAKELEYARKHMRFCIELYVEQIRGGRYFLHEHPDNATALKMPEIVTLATHTGVDATRCDMCAYGMTATDKEGKEMSGKSTKFLSNSPEVLKRISKRCCNRKEFGGLLITPLKRLHPKVHRHADISDGRLKQCQVYPRAFCKAVCEGIAAQKRLHHLGLKSEPLMSVEVMNETVPVELRTGNPSSDLHEDDGDGFVMADGTIATDDQTGAPLKPALTKQARCEEIVYFKEMKVYTKVPVEECWANTGKAPIATRWIDINKGDENEPNYRSRLVAKEFKTDERPELLAPTPPSECLRLLVNKLA